MTDWTAVFQEHLDTMLRWARGGERGGAAISPHLDPDACVMDAWQHLWLRDIEAHNPLGLWKVQAKREAIATYRKRGTHINFLRQAPALLADGDDILVPIRGFLPDQECPVCGDTFKPNVRDSDGERQQTCSPVCGQRHRFGDGCGDPDHRPFVTLASGKRRCPDCALARNRRYKAERKAA